MTQAPPPQHPQQPPPPQFDHVVLGFNWIVDRGSITPLVMMAQKAVEFGAKKLTICLSSPGGTPDQAFYAYEILRGLSTQIELVTHNLGTVHSAAMTIFLAGTKRYAAPGATFMVHGTTHNTGGSVTIDHVTYGLESIMSDDERAMKIMAERTGKDVENVKEWYAGQKLRDTAFAKEHGIIHDVAPLEVTPKTKFHQVLLP